MVRERVTDVCTGPFALMCVTVKATNQCKKSPYSTKVKKPQKKGKIYGFVVNYTMRLVLTCIRMKEPNMISKKKTS